MQPTSKRDANEKPIVDALKEAGFWVRRLSLPVDLLVWCPERDLFFLLEVKNPEKARADGTWPEKTFTPEQRELIELGPRHFSVVWTAKQAVRFCRGGEETKANAAE